MGKLRKKVEQVGKKPGKLMGKTVGNTRGNLGTTAEKLKNLGKVGKPRKN
jgi:hypothetical protein